LRQKTVLIPCKSVSKTLVSFFRKTSQTGVIKNKAIAYLQKTADGLRIIHREDTPSTSLRAGKTRRKVKNHQLKLEAF